MNTLQPRLKRPVPTNGAGAKELATNTDRQLIARAIVMTRVSYFTPEERDRLALLCAKLTGYSIEGGL